MIIVTGTNSKRVKDPVFLSARKFMIDRIAKLEAKGPSAELDLAKQRYDGLTAQDVIIEPPVAINRLGTVQACFVSRKTGFFRADIVVEKVEVQEIFDEFSVSVNKVADIDTLIDAIKSDTQGPGIVYLNDLQAYGIVMKKDDLNPDAVMNALNDIYWDTIKVETFDTLEEPSKASGVTTIEAINIDPVQIKLYAIEDIKALG